MFRKANFYIEKSGICKKIFKVFIDNNEDLYFSFSYCVSKEYKCGYAIIKAGESELTYSPKMEGTTSEIPVKLSYHQDGQMHFKTIDNAKIEKPPHYKLAEMKTTSFNELASEHFLTIELEGLENFETIKPKGKNEYHRGFIVDANTKRYKFIFVGNVNPEETIKTYSPVSIISIDRKTEPNPFHIAVQFQVFTDSITNNSEEEKPYFNVISGFKKSDNTPDKDMKFLYLYAE
jgi:hypothetical protein